MYNVENINNVVEQENRNVISDSKKRNKNVKGIKQVKPPYDNKMMTYANIVELTNNMRSNKNYKERNTKIDNLIN